MQMKEGPKRVTDSKALERYWTEQLSALPATQLPLDRARSAFQSFVRGRRQLRLADPFESDPPGRPLSLLCAALGAVLARYTQQADVVIGSVCADAESPEGLRFPNLIALRFDVGGDPTLPEVLARVESVVASAALHRDRPFSAVVETLERSASDSRPILHAAMVLCGEPHELSDEPVTDEHLAELGEHLSACDLVFVGRRVEGELVLECDFDTDLLDAETADRILGYLERAIEGELRKPDSRLSRLKLLSEDERRRILLDWNSTDVPYPENATLQSVFEAQVVRTPDAYAVAFEGEVLTYAELNRRANRLARRLRDLGVGRDVVVGVFLERSIEMVVALYAIVKAGGAYLPLDPEYPRERIAFMLADANAPVLVTLSRALEKLPEHRSQVLCLDTERELLASLPDGNLEPEAGPGDLAYVIYTSGSTGRPKGVMNTHRGIGNRLFWMQDEYRLDGHDRVLQKTPFSFDVSVWEFFWPLQVGAMLVVARPGGHRDSAYLVELVRDERITTLHFVPSMLQLFLAEPGVETLEGLERVFCSGEALPYELQERFFAVLDAELHNLYGPTEAAVDVTYWKCERDSDLRTVPIGRPVANTQIYILDEHLEPVPTRSAGELYIGGVQVARGYLNRPDLNRERFIPDPFRSSPEARLYRTGDLARFLRNGAIEYLGRIDHQVKLRGFRIELGEIESVLMEHPGVRESVVVLREDQPGNPRLAAYVTARGAGIDAAALRRHAGERLPEFMVPATFVLLETMPLSPNGKVDRSALPAPVDRSPAQTTSTKPASDLEARIAAIWRETLQRGELGFDQNFFDLGGHSLLLARCRVRYRDELGIDVGMTELFRYPTIESLASHVRERVGAKSGSGMTASEAGPARTVPEPKDDIAVIGMACRLPGAADVDEFWRNLEAGVESVTFFDDDDLARAGIPADVFGRPGYVKARATLGDVDCFDAAFFGYSPREAETMDPQQRLFLECAWHALEHSGYDIGSVRRRTGVFAGSGMNTYVLKNLSSGEHVGAVAEFQRMISNDKDFLATRVAYKLNLQGPAINVQTACSTSLVAIHMARRSLLAFECEMALAGGVSVSLPEVEGYQYQEGMILSPDGHCRAFDERAAGTVFGNGVAIVVLKRLADALADGDRVHAIIKGSSINNDGSEKIGYTAPSVEGQAAVISSARFEAGVPARSIGYVETHGTGTPLGDPIEVAALTQSFRRETEDRGFCGIGSVKSNIGHVDAAAGATGFIKAVLALEHACLPASLHFERPNPQLQLETSPFYVVSETRPWSAGDSPRRAGVSSFGIGGTNAHVILEEAPKPVLADARAQRRSELLCISAKSEEALGELAGRWSKYLDQVEPSSLGDATFTANAGRAHFTERLAVVGETAQALSEALAGDRGPRAFRGSAKAGERPKVAFLFTGQGAQWVGMGRELYESHPLFREELERCHELLRGELEVGLLDVLFRSDDGCRRLDETAYTQPALFAIEWSLSRVWRSWGVEPSAVLGHSVGEYVAACIAGVFGLEEGLRLIAARGRLMQALPRDGAMVAVFAEEERVAEALRGYEKDVSIASLNGPRNVVVSGRRGAVESSLSGLKSKGVETRELVVSHAFHSPLMDPMLDQFERLAGEVSFSAPGIAMVSNVSGELADAEVTRPDYWRRHVRLPVRFSSGMRSLESLGIDVYLEVGPSPVLLGMGRQCVGEGADVWLPSLRPGHSDWRQMQSSLAELYVRGLQVDWAGYERGFAHRRVPAPTYPFQKRRFWVEPGRAAHEPARAGGRALLGRRLRLPGSNEVRFETHFSRSTPPYVEDHRVFGVLVVAGASHVSMFLQGALAAFENEGCELEEIFFLQPFVLEESGGRTAQLVFRPVEGEGELEFELMSPPEGADEFDARSWTVHAKGRLRRPGNVLPSASAVDPDELRRRCTDRVDGTDFYESYWVQGPDAGPSFRWIETLWKGNGEALAKTRRPPVDDDISSYRLHPGLIEACFQVMRGGRDFESQTLLANGGDIYVPFAIQSVRFQNRPAGRTSPDEEALWCHAVVHEGKPGSRESFTADLRLFDERGSIIAEIQGFEVRRLPQETLRRSLRSEGADWLHRVVWERRPGRPAREEAEPETWLVLADEGPAGRDLAKRLQTRSGRAYIVKPGKSYSAASTGDWTIDLSNPAHYDRMLQEALGRTSTSLRGIFHLWSLDSDEGLADESRFARDQARGSESLLLLVQALERAALERSPRLVVATRGVHDVIPGTPPAMAVQAPVWGLARVLAVEYPDLDLRVVDLDPGLDSEHARRLFDEMTDEGDEDQIAWRRGERFVPRLIGISGRDGVDGRGPFTLSPEGSYLVTGGLGGLGLEVAKWLASRGARHLALMGRRPPSDSCRAAIQELEAKGVRVRVLQADVSRRDEAERAIQEIRETLPALCGIVHSAGVLDDGVLAQQTPERFRAVMAPKALGALLLHELTRDFALDFFVCFSSATSILGAGGQANYAAANAFLDAFAHHRSALGLPTTSVNWGPWAETGMAASMSERDQRRQQERGWGMIGVDTGLDLLGRLLAGRAVQVAVLPVQWSRFAQSANGRVPKLLESLAREPASGPARQTPSAGGVAESLRRAPSSERRSMLARYVKGEIASLLGLGQADSLDPRQGFAAMGMDSLMSVELRSRLQTGLGLKLSSTFAFDYSNIEDVTNYLWERLFDEPRAAAVDSARSASSSIDDTEELPESVDASIEEELARLEARLDSKR
jgi:amino acid adenylation domain-containing protein